MFRLIIIGVIALAAWLSYQRFYAPKPVLAAASPAVEERVIRPPSIQRDAADASAPSSTASPASPAKPFTCDGRIYCSQMTSCEEATFFLKNCPGTKMDGDNDGVPCEQQHCRK